MDWHFIGCRVAGLEDFVWGVKGLKGSCVEFLFFVVGDYTTEEEQHLRNPNPKSREQRCL